MCYSINMKNKTTLKIAEAAVKSAPRYTEDADLLISLIARDLNLESEAELAFCKQMVNNAIKNLQKRVKALAVIGGKKCHRIIKKNLLFNSNLHYTYFMKNDEKIIELMKIADQLRAEVIGASGQAQAMAMDLNISTDTVENFKRLEARLDKALADHSEKTDAIIWGEERPDRLANPF